MNVVEVNGGRVENGKLWLPPIAGGYANAQLDDYRGLPRRAYPHRAPVVLELRARFSHPAGQIKGTAGFGFWNAAYGDPSAGWPALPQACWFFYASEPNSLPFMHNATGWFACTIAIKRPHLLLLGALAPLPLLLRLPRARLGKRLWRAAKRRMGVRAVPITTPITEEQHYRIEWQPRRCLFYVDDRCCLAADVHINRPLGFVCWIDNQYLIAEPNGRLWAGVLPTKAAQWLQIDDLRLSAPSSLL